MKLYSYVVARDYGFAPNPFFGVCTLATCKPRIRSVAKIDDWVIGTGCAARGRTGSLVYAMRITDTLSFNDYFAHPHFQDKKPTMRGSKKQAFGDNIYKRNGKWKQLNSHHSFSDGSINVANVDNDTQADRILLSTDFVYFGGEGPAIPQKFRSFKSVDVCARRNHKSDFPPALVDEVVVWVRSLGLAGCVGRPLDWSKTA